jgi:hypothetical protein
MYCSQSLIEYGSLTCGMHFLLALDTLLNVIRINYVFTEELTVGGHIVYIAIKYR